MSRPESVASGGFFALPPPLVPLVAGLLVPGRTGYAWALVDLCMGAGDAIAGIAHRLFGDLAKTSKVHVYGVEMEAGRYQLAKRWKASFKPAGRFEIAHGDAFRLRAPRLDRYGNVSRGASMILLNPPYENGTMEARFLAHSLSFFGWEGVLVYVVPASALAKSAPILAQHFTQVHCYRFPDPHYAAFGQVVLVAQKRTPLLAPDAALEATLRGWASRPETIPVLTTRTRQVIEIPSFGHAGFEEWVVQPTDAAALLAKVRPWHMTTRAGESKPIPGIMPERAGEDLMRKVYPLASIPRPAFVSAALAADIYSGKMIHPADPKSGLPALLIKGVFDKADIEMDEKVDKEGVVKGKIKIEQPRLAVTVLDLATHAYHTLKNSVEVTGSTDLATMTMGDLLENYGPALLEAMFEACPILHDTRREDHRLPMPELGRPLLQAQAHAVMTCVKLLGGDGLSIAARRGLGAFLYGQIGVGKCLGLGTQVMRFDGSIAAVEDIREGDLLMGPDSKPRRVSGTTRGVGPLYRIVPTQGEPWVCNDAHILTLVHTTSNDMLDIPLSEYVSGARILRKLSGMSERSHAKCEFKQFFPEDGIDFAPGDPLPIDPYFLGVWYGDGIKKLDVVAVTKPDHEIRSMMIDMAKSWGLNLREYALDKCPSYRISGNPGAGNPLLRAMRIVVGNGSSLPMSYLTSSREDRARFLAGFLDTDGHLSHGCFEIIQKHHKWIDGVCFLARSLGLRATVRPKEVDGTTYWRCLISGDVAILPMRIARKKPVARQQRKRVSRTGIVVEPIGIGEFAGFQLDGDGRFLLGDFTVTHNTQVALATMRAIGSRRPLVMCPPNILRSWQDQIGIVTPEARVRWVDSIAAVDAFAVDKDLPGEQIGILSREAAKLGSAWQGIGSTAIVPPTDWAEGTETGSPWLNEPLRPALAVRLAVTHLGPVAPLAKGEDPGTAELYCAVETSDDGHTWRLLDVFPAVRARGDSTLTLTKAGRWLRIAWTATGDVSFGVEPVEAIRRPFCPRCGAPVAEDPDTLARLRVTCKARPRRPMEIPVGEDGPTRRCPIARMAEELARALLPVAPDSPEVGQLLTGRHEARVVAHLSNKAERHRAALGRQGHHGSDRDEILHAEAQTRWEGRKGYAMLRPLLAGVLATRMAWEDLPHDKGLYATKQALTQAILSLVAAVDDPDWIAREAVALYLGTKSGEEQRDADLMTREIVRQMLLLLPPGCDAQRRAEIQCKAAQCEEDRGSWRGSWHAFRQKRDALLHATTPPSEQPYRKEGVLVWGKHPTGCFEHALTALATFTDLARWETTEACGEQLYQTVPIPRRYPVAKYIARRHPGLFDFFLLDEAHQYASGTSAQSFAARRLIWTGMPSLLLTGTAMGGYAEQLFMMQWAIDREFREEFDQDEVRRFVEIYGFLKKLEEDRDPTTKAVVAYGSMTDRVERTTRVIGSAPGVLPLFLLKYMLRKACILHRSDFDFELPGVEEIAVPVYADAKHQKRYEELKDALKAQIKKDKRDPDKRGKLMGQVTRLPAYLDMATADCGNGEGGAFEITYPPDPAPKVRLIRGMKRPPKPRGELVARQDPFPVSYQPAKERELLKIVRAELAEGRPVVVFATNTPVLARLHRVLSEELGEPVAFLQANKVSAVDRQDWIDEQVIAKNVRVLVVNAVCVGVGLNNLVYFPTAIWFENPMCDAVIRRQADGRFDRLGKTLITRIYSLFYDDTVQEQLHKLLLHKVGVSMATDGLDASGALAAAGVGEQDRFSDLAIATVIVSMINGEYKSPKMSKAAVTLGAVLRV